MERLLGQKRKHLARLSPLLRPLLTEPGAKWCPQRHPPPCQPGHTGSLTWRTARVAGGVRQGQGMVEEASAALSEGSGVRIGGTGAAGQLPHVHPSGSRSRGWSSQPSDAGLLPFAAAAALLVGSGTALCDSSADAASHSDSGEGEMVTNWSATHRVTAKVVHRPETLEELEALVLEAHRAGAKIRPIGSGISPNGLALCEGGMVNLGLMDRVLSVDTATGRVTVQAGARVEQVVEALRPYGLTLQNYASVREQQIGGFIQVGAHGTGADIPPVDEQVVGLTLVTPAQGTLRLTAAGDGDLFHFARCALGALGVVGEVTLQAVPSYLLLEEAFVTDADSIRKHHRDWLREYKHIRYMWIPYSDAIVVVRSKPLQARAARKGAAPPSKDSAGTGSRKSQARGSNASGAGKETADTKSVRALCRLLCSLTPSCEKHVRDATSADAARALYRRAAAAKAAKWASPPSVTRVTMEPRRTLPSVTVESFDGSKGPHTAPLTEEEVARLSFTELRDELLALDPLDAGHVAEVNRAEAEFWRKSEGFRVGWSDQILGFDCGGQQWVSEVCFPVPRGPGHTASTAGTGDHGRAASTADTGDHGHAASAPGTGNHGHAASAPGTGNHGHAASAPGTGNLREPDMEYVESILRLIEEEGIAAPAPIEQRWTCGSRSPLSPAAVAKGEAPEDLLTSWVGIIMYLPSSDARQREDITDKFFEYKLGTARLLWDAYGAHEHWAKIEVPKEKADLEWIRARLKERFPLDTFWKLRSELDPKGILLNTKLCDLLKP